MRSIRFVIALWAAKLSVPALKLTKHNGTNFPGKLAVRLCPDFMAQIGKPARIIAVTGTNGKTTVSNLLCDALEKDGEPVLNNRYGSNIESGIATSLLEGVGLFGRSRRKTAVIEVDERSSPKIFPYLKPDILVITNLFRDSIMRNAHPQYIADILTKWIPADCRLVTNADDLIAASTAPENPRVYYALGPMEGDTVECENLINDVRICPVCGGELKYEYRRYHHIGKAACADCSFASPAADYLGTDVDTEAKLMTVHISDRTFPCRLMSDSHFNAYNSIAAIAALTEFGLPAEEAVRRVSDAEIVSSRHNEEDIGNIRLIMQMAKEKNALACSRAFDYTTKRPGRKELFLMMNCLGDVVHWSENVSWLYDCDFEFLCREGISQIVCTGARCLDYRLRLLFAGVPEELITCEEDEFKAAELLDYTPGDHIYMFYGTDSLTRAYKVREKIAALAREKAHEA